MIYSRHVPPIAARRTIAPNRATGASRYTPHRFDPELQATDDGSALIISNISAGELYKVDPETGAATLIDMGGVAVNGDGLVRQLTGAYTVLSLCSRCRACMICFSRHTAATLGVRHARKRPSYRPTSLEKS